MFSRYINANTNAMLDVRSVLQNTKKCIGVIVSSLKNKIGLFNAQHSIIRIKLVKTVRIEE